MSLLLLLVCSFQILIPLFSSILLLVLNFLHRSSIVVSILSPSVVDFHKRMTSLWCRVGVDITYNLARHHFDEMITYNRGPILYFCWIVSMSFHLISFEHTDLHKHITRFEPSPIFFDDSYLCFILNQKENIKTNMRSTISVRIWSDHTPKLLSTVHM